MSKQQSQLSQLASHGRGGAGNMADVSHSPTLQTQDLTTPTLKKPVVTTGRGGTGNMAKNNDPHETRLRQDVEAVPRRLSTTAQHSGRGGAGNVFLEDEEVEATQRLADRENAIDDGLAQSEKAEKAEETATKKKGWLFSKKA